VAHERGRGAIIQAQHTEASLHSADSFEPLCETGLPGM
jgi:hypothetical protein